MLLCKNAQAAFVLFCAFPPLHNPWHVADPSRRRGTQQLHAVSGAPLLAIAIWLGFTILQQRSPK
jgi:hypothetical protein